MALLNASTLETPTSIHQLLTADTLQVLFQLCSRTVLRHWIWRVEFRETSV